MLCVSGSIITLYCCTDPLYRASNNYYEIIFELLYEALAYALEISLSGSNILIFFILLYGSLVSSSFSHVLALDRPVVQFFSQGPCVYSTFLGKRNPTEFISFVSLYGVCWRFSVQFSDYLVAFSASRSYPLVRNARR